MLVCISPKDLPVTDVIVIARVNPNIVRSLDACRLICLLGYDDLQRCLDFG